ncbi:SchA/CurD-like domain-containing protein, partial [Saccharothrix coeruleofusca]
MNRYALTFAVRPGAEGEVAALLAGYARPRPGGPGGPGGGPPMLARTSVFMAGTTVVRVVDITCSPAEAVRYLAQQPQIRAVEDALRPFLVEDRDLSDEDGRRRFLATAVMRVVGRGGAAEHGAPRQAALYQALPGMGGEVARLLTAAPVARGGVTVFRKRDLVVHMAEGADAAPPVPLAGVVASLVL